MGVKFQEILKSTKGEIAEVKAPQVHERLRAAEPLVLLDVREKEEYNEGYIEGARLIPRGFLELRVEEQVPDKEAPVVVYCAGGVRSALAAKTLNQMGYKNVVSMAGGFTEWKRQNLKVVKPPSVSAQQKERYSRHLKIPEVGEAGQAKLLQSKVLLVGAGGLGSPAGVYLAAAGVGTLGIVDMDLVDESNLQRQILHWTSSLGLPKTDSAKRTLHEVNPDVKVVPYRLRLTSENILDIIKDYDVVVDGCDNFPTRYLVNDACIMLGKPNVYGSVFRFEGQASTFLPRVGPCYRCLFPEPTPAELAPT